MTVRHAAIGIAVAGLIATAACSSGGDDDIRVFAAASLTDAFEELAQVFEDETGQPVALQFAGSSVLATQIAEGAPADVFASANEVVMAGVDDTTGPAPFATNRLVVAVAGGVVAGGVVAGGTVAGGTVAGGTVDGGAVDGGAAGRRTVAEIIATNQRPLVALCAPEVPCGTDAEQLLGQAGVDEMRITRETDVKAVVAKVELGEVDLGVVYASDIVAASGRLEGEPLTTDTVIYPIATLEGSADGADEFVEFVLSAPGQAVLRSHGFGPPP